MALLDQVQFLERMQFFNGQRLFAADLQDLDTFHREMRELHNRSLHQPGVGSGFAVSGQTGDREVRIGPGYAIDVEGREIIHTQSRTEPVPPVAGDSEGNPAWYELAVSSPDDDDLEESETREGICLPRGVTRLREEPEFCWIRLEQDAAGVLHARDAVLGRDLAEGRRIRIARVSIQDCRLQSLSTAERLNARPPTQPYIACGRQAATEWAVSGWVPLGERLAVAVVYLDVDTTSAGFATTPCYAVTLEWSLEQREQFETRMTLLASPPAVSSAPAETEKLLIFPILRHVESPTPTSFRLTTIAVGAQPERSEGRRVAAGEMNVVWIGVE